MSQLSAIGDSRQVDPDAFTPGIEPQATWCPGCGHFSVLKTLKQAMVERGKNPDEVLVVSGIGCSGKLTSYFGSYGFHAIHGRGLPIARGAKLANPELEVVAAGGDGDGYGIGGNHFTHAARENHDLLYIVMNNEIFGLTKGQTSPTSPLGHRSKTQPSGSAKSTVRPLEWGLTAGASYVARTAAVNPGQATEILVEAMKHDGFAHVDYLTQCPTWNKDAKQYVPYIDIQEEGEYDFDVHDREDAARMMREAETRLHRGEILTGRYYVDESRPSYEEEKRRTGEIPEQPLADRFLTEESEWRRSAELLDRHR